MQTIIDLWYGNIAPCEHCGSHDPKLNKLIGQIERHRNDVSKCLDPAKSETFQKYIDSSEAYWLRMLELAFSDGFCLGSKLAIESCCESK